MKKITDSFKNQIIGLLSAELIDNEKLEAARAEKNRYVEKFIQRHKTSFDHLKK